MIAIPPVNIIIGSESAALHSNSPDARARPGIRCAKRQHPVKKDFPINLTFTIPLQARG
jgi:hypothetical protein